MTLSTWFRDYVYIPLGGNRFGPWHTVRNLWIVFLLTGVWHGASWTFIMWGLWHGLFLSLERIAPVGACSSGCRGSFGRLRAARRDDRVGVLPRVRLSNTHRAYLARMFAFEFEGQALLRAFDLVTAHSLTVIATAFVFSLPLWPMLRSRLTDAAVARAMPATSAAYVALVMILSFAAMAGDENSPFLYFRF